MLLKLIVSNHGSHDGLSSTNPSGLSYRTRTDRWSHNGGFPDIAASDPSMPVGSLTPPHNPGISRHRPAEAHGLRLYGSYGAHPSRTAGQTFYRNPGRGTKKVLVTPHVRTRSFAGGLGCGILIDGHGRRSISGTGRGAPTHMGAWCGRGAYAALGAL